MSRQISEDRSGRICEVPNDDTCCDANVHRMFGTKLWNLQTTITGIYNFLLHSFDFVAKNYRILGPL